MGNLKQVLTSWSE